MQNRDSFSGYHPLVNFLFFGLVLGFSMCLMNPICLLISLVSATVYHVQLKGRKALRSSLTTLLPMMLLAALINPAFNHEGVTVLSYLPSGNVLTLESILYGIGAAMMLAAVVQWFGCFNEVVTSDKFVYLFGRIIPALSLVLSMTLRFVPRFRAQTQVVRNAQTSLGRSGGDGFISKMKHGITILSILITWSLENAIETADSMRSRGYGLPGRSAYSVYRFDDRDKGVLLWLLGCFWVLLFACLSGGLHFRYYPSVKLAALTPFSVSFYLFFLALCLTPVILNAKEASTWKRLQSEA